MKKLLLPLLLLLFVGCNDEPNVKIHSPQKGSSEQEMIKNELATGKRYDTIVLDYRLGMTKKQFRDYTFQLRDKEEVIVNDNGITFSITDLEGNEYKPKLLPDFYKDSLYSIILLIEPKDRAFYIMPDLSMLYMSKYRQNDIEIIPAKDHKCRKYIWIDGNRKIELYCKNSNVRIEYIDMALLKKAERERVNKRKHKVKETKSNI